MNELESNITFSDIAANDGAGITYRRVPSARNEIFDQLRQQPVYTLDQDLLQTPERARGAPGIAIFDYDGDGDEDIYVTNGPGASNSLYSSQLGPTGELTFVDVATAAGVGALDQDSNGAAYGDIDNDGDLDLLVLGTGEPNQLFENQGDGTFLDITATSGIGGGNLYSSSASFGDVNGDGLLDIVVANTFPWENQIPLLVEPFASTEHNQLFLNLGNNVFEDVSDSSGLTNLVGFPEENAGAATITWAISLVDYDLDGDLDIIQADDQGAVPSASLGGVDRGYIQLLNNDGTGNFTNVTIEANLNVTGGWMGLSFGDFNGDGYLDIFVTNVGDYASIALNPNLANPDTSRWFLGQEDGSFIDSGAGELGGSPWGWGTSTLDYDNDSDTDIVFHGGIDLLTFIDASNPGAILNNDGGANFTYDTKALANSTDHLRRTVYGLATGDLDQDGFVDIVSVSNFDFPDAPLEPYPSLGSALDGTAGLVETFLPTDDPNEFVFSGLEFPNGTLSVEINSGDNGNGFVAVETVGTVDLTADGSVNRDGIGAVVFLTPEDGNTAIQPILGGSSHASQDSLIANFGLGTASQGTIEILWPGGVRNRLYDVESGTRTVFPEIPYSFDDSSYSLGEYKSLVEEAITQLVTADTLTESEGEQFLASAVRAFVETQEQELVFGNLDADDLDAADGRDNFDGNRDLVFTGAGEDLVDASGGIVGGNRLYGGSDEDELLAGGSDRLFGGTSNDILDASLGSGGNRLYGGEGNDELFLGSGDRAFGGLGEDVLDSTVGAGGNRLYGGEGNDTFFLGSGDRALGGEGNDRFFVVVGGDNILTGGEGVDAFWVVNSEIPDSANTITDLQLDLDLIGIGGFAESDLSFGSNSDGDAILSLNNSDVAIFSGISSGELATANFVFA